MGRARGQTGRVWLGRRATAVDEALALARARQRFIDRMQAQPPSARRLLERRLDELLRRLAAERALATRCC